MTLFGHGELVAATSPAAARTPTLDMTSLREFHVLGMFSPAAWNRHRYASETRSVTSASPPKACIRYRTGRHSALDLDRHFPRIPRPSSRMKAPLNAATPAFYRSLRPIAKG